MSFEPVYRRSRTDHWQPPAAEIETEEQRGQRGTNVSSGPVLPRILSRSSSNIDSHPIWFEMIVEYRFVLPNRIHRLSRGLAL